MQPYLDDTVSFWLQQGHTEHGSSGGVSMRDRRIAVVDTTSFSPRVLALVNARRERRRRRDVRVWTLRLLVATGGLWLLVIVVGGLIQSG